jgi:hypothetical protein
MPPYLRVLRLNIARKRAQLKVKRYTEEQIIAVLKEGEAGEEDKQDETGNAS